MQVGDNAFFRRHIARAAHEKSVDQTLIYVNSNIQAAAEH